MASIQSLMSRLEKLEAVVPGSDNELTHILIKAVASNGNGGPAPEDTASNTVTCPDAPGELRLMDGESEEELIERAKHHWPAINGVRVLLMSWEP